jgi:hypothetical protein
MKESYFLSRKNQTYAGTLLTSLWPIFIIDDNYTQH